ncbi:MFS transporter [Jiangella aurantiaca]|uniref:MFS transporter n=1 Tax=Jiangella aurantiaca TaxID=2530373 RepID=UPI0013A5EE97|nr:glycoside-pentoside-hexuronide (GPH):cation symporter [Jiangella aurantiaca]
MRSPRAGYAAADGAATLIWTVVGGYLVVYYTDVAGLPAAAVGTLFLLVRMFDAIVDPVIGVVIDRTRTRWGRSRPYFLWASVPFATLAVLTFSVPDWSESGRLAWAYVTYLLLSVLYSLATIPVVSILAALTADDRERVRLSSLRTAGNLVTSVAAGAAILPLVAMLGGGDDGRGYTLAMFLLGSVSVVLFLFAFATLRERAAGDRRLRVAEVRTVMRGNLPLKIMIGGGLLINAASVTRVASTVYFCRDYLGREDLVPVLALFPVLMIVGLVLARPVAQRIGKRNALVVALIVQAIGFALPIPFGQHVGPVLAGTALASAALGLLISVEYAVLADIVDYTDWRYGVRAAGVIASLAAFSAKAGSALGGAALGWLLAAGGYRSGAEQQPAAALNAIRFCFYGLPVIVWLLVAVLLAAYKVDQQLARIRADLAAREVVADVESETRFTTRP